MEVRQSCACTAAIGSYVAELWKNASELRHVFYGNHFANSVSNDLPNNSNSCFFPTKNLLYFAIAGVNILAK